jgi:hypothetical protein
MDDEDLTLQDPQDDGDGKPSGTSGVNKNNDGHEPPDIKQITLDFE